MFNLSSDHKLKILGSRGEAEKTRELEAAAEKERLKAAAAAKGGVFIQLHSVQIFLVSPKPFCALFSQAVRSGHLRAQGRKPERFWMEKR